jgi:nucleoside 2-deoxyribosyltransferase
MKFYLSGPMTGLPEYNYPAFREAAEFLRAGGLQVMSPHEALGGHGDRTREEYMREDLKQLLECDAIIMLPDWHLAAGAKLELEIAVQCGMFKYKYAQTDSFVQRLQKQARIFDKIVAAGITLQSEV